MDREPSGSLEKCEPDGSRSKGSDCQGADEGVNGDERENEGVNHGRKLLLARGKFAAGDRNFLSWEPERGAPLWLSR